MSGEGDCLKGNCVEADRGEGELIPGILYDPDFFNHIP